MGRKVNKAAVIGAGVMGSGIAALLAGIGIKTLLFDIVPPDLIKEDRKEKKKRDRIALSAIETIRHSTPPILFKSSDIDNIAPGNIEDDISKLGECDWIIEAVIEDAEIKQSILKKIASIRKKSSIISTNTSGIPLKTLSKNLDPDFRSHFLGIHFFNPVRYMKLAEIIPGEETKQEIIDFISIFLEQRLGKGIVQAKDAPNFIANRIAVHSMLTSMALMNEEGLTIPEVDALLGRVVGRPKTALFKTLDIVGIDVFFHVARNTYEQITDDEEREIFRPPVYLEKMVGKKFLGKKNNSGFYKTEITPEFEKKRFVLSPRSFEYEKIIEPYFPCLEEAEKLPLLKDKIRTIFYGNDRGARFVFKSIASHLIYSFNRIGKNADSIIEIDRAMKWGFNFELGPFELWDIIEIETSILHMKENGFSIPSKIEKMMSSGHFTFYKEINNALNYYDVERNTYLPIPAQKNSLSLKSIKKGEKIAATCPSCSLVDIGDGVFCLEFHSKLNTLNSEMIHFHHRAMKIVEERGVGLVIGNQSSASPAIFSAGADLNYLLKLLNERDYETIETFVTTGQYRLHHVQYTGFPVVAAPYGLTLGGGCELCLSADRIVTHSELYMGLVEMSVGLLPAAGGCLNLWKKFLRSIPPSMTDIDLCKLFLPAFMNIALSKVSTSAMDARNLGFLGPQDRIVMNRDHLIHEAKKEVLRMVDDGYTPPVKEKIRAVGKACQGMIQAELYNMQQAGFISEYDAYLAQKTAYVLSGGEISYDSMIDEDVILRLERESFLELLKEEKTQRRMEHMLEYGKPLRN